MKIAPYIVIALMLTAPLTAAVGDNPCDPLLRYEAPPMLVMPGGTVTFLVRGWEYKDLDGLTVVYGDRDDRPAQYVTASFTGETDGSDGRWVRVSASTRADSRPSYRILGSRGRTRVTQFPLRLRVDLERQTLVARPAAWRSEREHQNHAKDVLPEGRTLLARLIDHRDYKGQRYYGVPYDHRLGEGGFRFPCWSSIEVPASAFPVEIDSVSPHDSGVAGGLVAVHGFNLPHLRIRFGDLILEEVDYLPWKIVGRLPDTPMTEDLSLWDPETDQDYQVLIKDYDVTYDQDLPIFAYFDADAGGLTEVDQSQRWLNTYLLAQLSFLVYSDPEDESPSDYEDRMQIAFEGWGLETVAIENEWVSASFLGGSKGSTQCVLARNDEAMFLVFCGSEFNNGGADWLSNSNLPMSPLDGASSSDVWVHNGDRLALELVWDEIESKLESKLGNRKLWITGHSLGGALAQIAALRIILTHGDSMPIQGVVTFGQPRAGNGYFADELHDELRSRSQRWHTEGDVVPTLPTSAFDLTYRHTGMLHNLYDSGGVVLDAQEMGAWEIPPHLTYPHRLWKALDVYAPTIKASFPMPAPLGKE